MSILALHFQKSFFLRTTHCLLEKMSKSKIFNRLCRSYNFHSQGLIEQCNILFSNEKKRQINEVGRIEKISVTVQGPPENVTLLMNGNLSTPFDCSRHISEEIAKQAVLALIDSEIIWDMHRPLVKNCNLKFLQFDDDEPALVNKAFWESCSFILGAVISNAFKDNVNVMLHSYPLPDVRSGSFAYDVKLSLNNWSPSSDELKILAAEMLAFAHKNYKFERLSVNKDLALKIMNGNEYKQEQIISITSKNEDNKLTLYRIGTHIDISNGPLIADSSFIGRCSITAVHQLKTNLGSLYRFQGIALPKQIMLNHFAYGILESRARKLNPGLFPDIQSRRILHSG